MILGRQALGLRRKSWGILDFGETSTRSEGRIPPQRNAQVRRSSPRLNLFRICFRVASEILQSRNESLHISKHCYEPLPVITPSWEMSGMFNIYVKLPPPSCSCFKFVGNIQSKQKRKPQADAKAKQMIQGLSRRRLLRSQGQTPSPSRGQGRRRRLS